MSHNYTRSSRGLTRFTPRPTPLVQRLKRLNENGLAEPGEEGYPNLITLNGFKTLVENANLNSVHLPHFSPLRSKAKYGDAEYQYGEQEIKFHNVNLKWAVLSHLGMYKPKRKNWDDPRIFVFEESNLDGASLDKARCALKFIKCTMNGINLSDLKVSDNVLNISECEATGANFSHVGISGSGQPSFFSKSNFKNAKFVKSRISSTYINDCDLNGADFSNSKITEDSSFGTSNFKNAKFVSTVLMQIYFEKCELIGADFSNSEISSGTKMDKCNLQNSKFVRAELSHGVTFKDSNLNGADFSESEFVYDFEDWQYETFANCTFVGTNFKDAKFKGVWFIDCDLMGVIFGKNTDFSAIKFENCINVPGTHYKNWGDEEYKDCDNEEWNKDEDEDDDEDDDEMVIDPDFVYKQDPISFKRLRRGTGMVMVKKKNGKGDWLQPDCYNRKTMLDWFKTTQRTNKQFTNPKNRDPITDDFFVENGFPTFLTRHNRGGGRLGKKRTQRRGVIGGISP